jgi:hypothetical protein
MRDSVAETPTRFFLKIRPWTLTFVKDGARVVRLDILDSGETVPGTRIDEGRTGETEGQNRRRAE